MNALSRMIPGLRRVNHPMPSPEDRLTELGLVLPAPLQLPPGVTLPFPWVRIVGTRAIFVAPPLQAAMA